jgi:hypothetical protein
LKLYNLVCSGKSELGVRVVCKGRRGASLHVDNPACHNKAVVQQEFLLMSKQRLCASPALNNIQAVTDLLYIHSMNDDHTTLVWQVSPST